MIEESEREPPGGRFSQWPRDRRLPTQAEYDAAKARFDAEITPEMWTDASLDFGFCMATCDRLSWWRYFFPQDAAHLEKQLHRDLTEIPLSEMIKDICSGEK